METFEWRSVRSRAPARSRLASRSASTARPRGAPVAAVAPVVRWPVPRRRPRGRHPKRSSSSSRGWPRCSGTRTRRRPRSSGASAARFPSERALLDRVRVYLDLCERELRRKPPAPKTVEERLTAATAALNDGDEDRADALARSVVSDDADQDLALLPAGGRSGAARRSPKRRSRTWPGRSRSARKPGRRPDSMPTSNRSVHTTISGD